MPSFTDFPEQSDETSYTQCPHANNIMINLKPITQIFPSVPMMSTFNS